MAIIKCPECGRQISDKAPTCPSCGVEIAGKITKCPNCGEIYFSNLEMCPNCHELNPSLTRMTPPTGMSQQTPASQASMTQQQEAETQPDRMQSDKKKFAARRLSGSRLVLRHLSEQQHLLLHPFLRFAHSNLILRTAVTAREPRKRKKQPWRHHHLSDFRLPRLWHFLLFL